jgi:hypothetical protein
MRKFILAVALLASGGSAFADSFEESCEAELPKGDIVVEAKRVEPVIDYSRSFLDITQVTHESVSESQFAMGATITELARAIQTDFHGKRTFLGKICLRAKLRVTLSYAPMRVLIAKEFGESSCFAREVYLHEMRHVRTYENFLKGYAVRLQDLLVGALGQEVYYFDSEESARKVLQNVVDKQIATLLNKSIKDINLAQNRIDTSEESHRLGSACPKESAKLAALWAAFKIEKNWEAAE